MTRERDTDRHTDTTRRDTYTQHKNPKRSPKSLAIYHSVSLFRQILPISPGNLYLSRQFLPALPLSRQCLPKAVSTHDSVSLIYLTYDSVSLIYLFLESISTCSTSLKAISSYHSRQSLSTLSLSRQILRRKAISTYLLRRSGGLGSRPKKMYGERLGDGVECHLMSPTTRR